MADRCAFGRDYYEKQYRDYARQNPSRKLRFYRNLVERGPHPAGLRILDVGCAFGGFLAQLEPGWERFGVDASEYAIERAKASVVGVRFARAVSGEIPFEGPFDVITAFDVLEHIADVEGTVRAIRNLLAPGGRLIFVVPVYDGPTGALVRLLDRDPTHIHRRSRRFWLRTGEAHLTREEWWGVFRYLLPGGYYVHHASRYWRSCSPAIACIFRRP